MTAGLKIVWQSPEEIRVKDVREPVILYCICSLHSLASYKWEKIGEPQRSFPSTSVLYIREGGLFSCTVESRGQVKKSRLIDVSIEPGTREE